MFTGIVEELGQVTALPTRGDSAVLTVRVSFVGAELKHGASICVNGVCLTVVGQHRATATDGPAVTVSEVTTAGELDRLIDFDVMAETLNRSVIGGLRPGEVVNLERAVPVDGRLDGHVVQGHVDGTGTVLARTPGDGWELVRVSLPSNLARYVAEKGSIAVDGVSLTVTGVGPDWFDVGLIPQTLRATTLGRKQPGQAVNLETDVLARYAERILSVPAAPITEGVSDSGRTTPGDSSTGQRR